MSGWIAPPRGPAALDAYRAAENDRTVSPQKYRLGEDAVPLVIERACRGTDSAILGADEQWRPGLTEYLGSAAEDGRLNALGAMMVQNTAVGRLIARQRMAERPEVKQRALQPPIVIIGGWRTGTTYLFRMLATDPRLRAPLPAELGLPWKLPGDLDPELRAQRLQAAANGHQMLHILNPTMAAVHDSGPQLAEECVLGMGTTLRNWGFTATTRLNGYARWLAGQDLSEEYRQHRRMLQILDAGDGRRWVLKAPAHTAELDHLVATYPGACVVHLHRDVAETVASGASLFATYRSTYSDEVDGADVGRAQLEQTELWLRRALKARESEAAQRVTWVDVQYTDLVSRPVETLHRIYARAGLDSADAATMVTGYEAKHPRNAKGAHHYAAAEFGLDADEVRERLGFYTDAFGVPT